MKLKNNRRLQQNKLILLRQQQINQQLYSISQLLAQQMSSPQLDQSLSAIHSQHNLKQLHSLSTLTYEKSPSPILLNTTGNVNLSRFKSIDITEKAKKNIANQIKNSQNTARIKSKRNQSLGNIGYKDLGNPQNLELIKGFTNKQEAEVDYIELNKETVKETKAKSFLNKLFGSTKPSPHHHNVSTDSIATTQKMEMTLPVIQQKRHSTKKTNFLQQWLDEALDPQDLSPSHLKQLSAQNPLSSSLFEQQPYLQPISSYLTTVKKYQIDKIYLKSQNIPTEIIDRLYNTLFIYTHGINNVFTDLLSFVKSGSGEEGKDSRIVASFWKCFVKLLEGCTSFQTSFQKVEEQYKARVNELREIISMKESEYGKERQQLEATILRFQKEKIDHLKSFSKLQSEYRIAASTLQLTDNAFNQQVQLRLKFQQKINHIYCSYEELRNKYQTIIGSLQIKNEESLQNMSQEVKLKERIRQLEGRVFEFQEMLSKERQKVKQREVEVSVKKQELLDLEMNLQLRQEKDKQEEDVMQVQVNRNSLLKAKYDQLENRLKMREYTLEGLTNKVKEQTQNIQEYREMNESLHQKYNQSSQKLVEYEAHKIYQSAQISRLSAQLAITKQKLQLSESLKSSLQSNLSITLQQLNQAQFQVNTRAAAMQQINSNIQQLKAIKNKYEQLWKIMEKEKTELQNERNKIHQKYDLEKQQFIGLKMLYESREKHIKDIQAKHDKEKELLKRKITGYNEVVTKKESLILTYQKNEQEKGDLLLKRSYRIEQLEKELIDQKALHLKKEKNNEYLLEQVASLQKQIKQLEQSLKTRGNELQGKLTQLDISQEELSSLKNLLTVINTEQNSSIINLTTLFEEYRTLVNKKGQHIHPMLYEDLAQQYNRLKLETLPKLERAVCKIKEVNQKLEKGIESKDIVIKEKKVQIERLIQGLAEEKLVIEGKTKQISDLNRAISSLQKTINNQSSAIAGHEKSLTQKSQKLTQLSTALESSHQSISSLTNSLTAKQVQIDRLTSTISELSLKISTYDTEMQQKQKHNPYLVKIEKIQKELTEVRKELGQAQKELKAYKNVARMHQQIQTQPQCEVVIYEPRNTSTSIRKNKFTNQQSKQQSKQVQVCLSPYDSIPEYIDNQIAQIKKQERNQSALSFAIKSKPKDSPQHAIIKSDKSLTKLEPKEPITRREELRRALRMTYMRR